MTRRYLDQRVRLSMLRVVDALEAHGSLLKASAALGISQPALTKNLQELEEVLQLRLFDRHSRGVIPTPQGKVFIEAARRILANLRRLEENLDQFSNSSRGTVALGAMPGAAAGVLPQVLALLKAAHPHITVRLQQGLTTELVPMLASGELDMIVGSLYEPIVPDGFRREPLWSDSISLLARSGHPIFAETVSVESLHRYDLVLPTVGQRVGQEVEHLVAKLGLEPTAPLRSNSDAFIREMLCATDSISMMPRLAFLGDVLRGTLRTAPLPIPVPERLAGLMLPRDRTLPPAAQAFVQHLRSYIGESVTSGVAAISKSA
jgi:LysR family pca operon transcriptional activator